MKQRDLNKMFALPLIFKKKKYEHSCRREEEVGGLCLGHLGVDILGVHCHIPSA